MSTAPITWPDVAMVAVGFLGIALILFIILRSE